MHFLQFYLILVMNNKKELPGQCKVEELDL